MTHIHVFSALVEGIKPSTKAAWKILDGLTGRKNLLVVVDRNDTTSRSSLRNLENVHVLVPDQLNTYDVLCADDVVFTEGALSTFLAGPIKGRPAKTAVDEPAKVETPDEAKVETKAAAEVQDTPSAKAADDEEETT